MTEDDGARRALVTGATSGIGQAVAERLLEGGWRVLGLGRELAKLEVEHPRLEKLALDLQDLDALPERLEALVRERPPFDAAVLAAGRGELGGFEELSYAAIRSLLELDLTSQLYLARALLPAMKRRGRGDLVFLGSEAALRPGRRGAVYSASKAGIRGFAQALREECAKSGVRVSVVNPGMVRTPFFDGLPIEPGDDEANALRPEEVAEAVAMVLAQRPGAVIDEVNLSPLKRVVQKRRRAGK